MEHKEKKWTQEFNQEFNQELFIPEDKKEILVDVSSKKIKDFIQNLLDKQKVKIIEEIEKMQRKTDDNGQGCVSCGLDIYECICIYYNATLDEAIDKIRKLN